MFYEEITSKIINRVLSEQEAIFEHSLRNNAEPPIKGEITRGKIKWRGIILIEKGNSRWLSQRGKRISPIIELEMINPVF